MCLASLVISIKMTEDDTCKNTYYARLGGVSNAEMVRLEVEFMKLVDFQVNITEFEFKAYKADLMKHKLQ